MLSLRDLTFRDRISHWSLKPLTLREWTHRSYRTCVGGDGHQLVRDTEKASDQPSSIVPVGPHLLIQHGTRKISPKITEVIGATVGASTDRDLVSASPPLARNTVEKSFTGSPCINSPMKAARSSYGPCNNSPFRQHQRQTSTSLKPLAISTVCMPLEQ